MYLLDTDVLVDIQRGHTPAIAWFASLTTLPSVPGFVVMESSSAGYVLDTNTLVSAVLLEHSTPGQALRRALKRGEVLVSPCTLY